MFIKELDFILSIPTESFKRRIHHLLSSSYIVKHNGQLYTLLYLRGATWERYRLMQGKTLKFTSCNHCRELLPTSRYRTNSNTCRKCERKTSLIPRIERHNEKGRGFISAAEMREIAARFTNCGYCDRTLKKDLSNVHIDHFVPYRLGGQNIASNIIICCQYCNHAKHSHDFYEWVHDYFGHYSRSLVDEVINRVETYFKKYY